MSLATKLIGKLDKVLKKYGLTERTVYKRFYTSTGGDPLIGRSGTLTSEETLLSPQPMIVTLDINFGDKPRDYIGIVNGQMAVVGDCIAYLSPSSITREELSDKGIVFVFKLDAVEEEMHLVTFEATPVNNIVAMYKALLRSRGR